MAFNAFNHPEMDFSGSSSLASQQGESSELHSSETLLEIIEGSEVVPAEELVQSFAPTIIRSAEERFDEASDLNCQIENSINGIGPSINRDLLLQCQNQMLNDPSEENIKKTRNYFQIILRDHSTTKYVDAFRKLLNSIEMDQCNAILPVISMEAANRFTSLLGLEKYRNESLLFLAQGMTFMRRLMVKPSFENNETAIMELERFFIDEEMRNLPHLIPSSIW